MSAFFWFPALVENKFLNLNFLISMRYDFHKNFISLVQLFRLPWDHQTDTDGISFQIGFIHLFLVLVPLGVLLNNFTKNQLSKFSVLRPTGPVRDGGAPSRFAKEGAFHYFFFLLVGLMAAFFTLPPSYILWEKVSLLRFVQLPWRFLTVIVFSVSLLAGSFMVMFRNETVRNFVLAMVVFFIIFSSLRFLWPANFSLVDQVAIKKNISNYVFLGEGERTPKWILLPPLGPPSQKFEFLQGKGHFSKYSSISSIEDTVQVHANQDSLVCFHSFYFPGWRVFIDGKETQIYPNSPYGVILFIVPSGNHMLRAVFGPTIDRIFGVVVSWGGVGLLIVLMFFRRKRIISAKAVKINKEIS